MRVLRLLALAFGFLGAAVAFPARAQSSPDLAARRAIEKKCLDCHQKENLCGSRPDGRLVSVRIDPDRYRRSVHYAKDLTCLDCHPDANADYHPREGVRITACGSCHDHEDEARDYAASLHGKLLGRKTPNAPDCFSCHSNHYVVAKADPESLAHPSRIRETCGVCHPAEAGATPAGSWWAGGRLSAHAKNDFSEDFSTRACTRCHAGADTHRTPPAEERTACMACHDQASPSRGDREPLAVGAVHAASPRHAGGILAAPRAAGLFATLLAIGFAAAIPAARWARRRGRGKAAGPGETATPQTGGTGGA